MSFDLLAPHYRGLEIVLAGSKLQRCRTAFFTLPTKARRILIAGEGNGRFLVECRRHFSEAHITCLDSSVRMLDLAKQRLLAASLGLERIDFVHADALEWAAPEGSFDLIVTNFFLDCFRPEQLERLVALLAGAAETSASWWLADFRVPAAGLCRARALLIHRLMYLFFRVATGLPAIKLTPPDCFLQTQGFALHYRLVSEWGLFHADEWKRSKNAGVPSAN